MFWASLMAANTIDLANPGAAAAPLRAALQPLTGQGVTANGLLVPYYLDPGDPYSDPNAQRLLDLIRQYHALPVLVVLNPSNGPGTVTNANYSAFIRMLQAAGARVCGYVATGYATRPEAEVKTDIDLWQSLYAETPVDGIFLDEQPWMTGPGDSGSEYVDLYARYNDYCHSAGLSPVIANPGANQQEAYFATRTSDICVVHEHETWPTEASMAGNYIGGHVDYSFTRRAALVYAQPSLDTAELGTLRKYCQWLYVTDDEMTGEALNPWDGLPTYLDELFAALAGAA